MPRSANKIPALPHSENSSHPARVSATCGKLYSSEMIQRLQSARIWLILFAIFLAAPLLWAQTASSSAPTIVFRKIFKSSYPEFVEIKVPESGACTADIRQLSDDPSPQPFRLDSSVVHRIFNLAGDLHDFNGVNLEIHRRVANLGEKTFIYQSGTQVYQTTFNYSTNASAQQLLDLFENLTREQIDISDLQRTMQYDHLGVYDIVERAVKDYDDKLLPDPPALLPALDKLALDNTYVNIARDAARNLAGRIRASR